MPREWLIQHRAGTLAEWAAAEASGPVLLAGERAYITDTKTDVVGDGVTKVASLGAVGSGTYAALRRLDTSRWVLCKPPVMSSPPTLTAGVANAASAIASSVVVSGVHPGALSFVGGRFARGTTFPNYLGAIVGAFPQATSSAPVAVEFIFDTVDSAGRFEIYQKGAGASVRVCVMTAQTGRWEYASAAASFTHSNNGSSYRDLVTLGAAGTYHIRLEFDPSAVLYGIGCGPTDTVQARQSQSKRYIVVGDSFSEPTIVDSASSVKSDGWPVVLSHITGMDVWCAGSGGTGYLNPGVGGRVKFRDRLAQDVLAFNPDGIIWAGGINDYSLYTAAQIQAEALSCFQQAAAHNPRIDQVVLSPFWPRDISSGATAGLLAARDAIKAAAAQVGGTRFIDLLSLPLHDYMSAYSGTLLTQASPGAVSVSVGSLPTYIAGQVGVGGLDEWYVEIGAGQPTAEVRAVTNVGGSGPYSLTVAALTNTHPVGESVVLRGPSYMTGTGKQGTTTGTGNADRYTGSDGTHPTVAGQAYIASVVASLWARSIQAVG